MPRTRRRLAVALAALLVPAALGSACSKDDGDKEEVGYDLGQDVTLNGRLPSGAQWELAAPDDWNGTLLLFSHGYVGEGKTNAAALAPDPITQAALLDRGFAMVGTSFATTGWAVDDALLDQMAVLDVFADKVKAPKQTIAVGTSLGGLITVGLLELHPDRFAGGFAGCAPLAGSTVGWDTFLDTEAVLKALLAPDSDLPLVQIGRDGDEAYEDFLRELAPSLQTPAGRARAELAAVYSGLRWTEGTTDTTKLNDLVGLLYFSIRQRVEVERRFGGNVSSNAGVDYAALLDASGRRAEVEAIYRSAGVDLAADLATLAASPRVEADPAARAGLAEAYDPTGVLEVPLITLHSTGDPLTVWAHEAPYAAKVAAAGQPDLLRQVAVDREGHCNLTPAEVVTTLDTLVERLDSGSWPVMTPATLETEAVGEGGDLNVGLEGGVEVVATRPAFTAEEPPPYPRSALGSP